MREDIEKVISEGPKSSRTGQSSGPLQKAAALDDAGDQFNEGANHLRQRRQKLRTTRFSVLERYLVRSIGKPWDAVFAEICRNSDPRTPVGTEIRDRVKETVTIECWIEGRGVMTHGWRGNAETVRGLYVHPKTGLLARIL